MMELLDTSSASDAHTAAQSSSRCSQDAQRIEIDISPLDPEARSEFVVETMPCIQDHQRNDDPSWSIVEPRGLHHDDVGCSTGIASRCGMDIELRHQRVEYSSPQTPY